MPMRMAALSLLAPLALAALAADSAPTPPKLRLPAGVRPIHYALDLHIVPANPTYSGTVTIDVRLDGPTSLFWLNATDLTVDGAELRAGGATQPARVVAGGEDFVGFQVARPLAKGTAQLVVRWHGKMDDQRSRGLYRVAEGAGANDWYAYTFFEPTDARRAFPCFDEPSYKVPWKLTLHVARGHVALANAPVASETDEPDGSKAVVFAESKPLPSYLVAFVVGPFDVIGGGSAGRAATPIRFIVPRGRGAETRYAREITPRILTELEKFFDMPYPYGKLDVAVVPRYWGTMEHPGIVALGQPLTLIKPAEEGLHRKISYVSIAAHELAHYWFGDYVTCRWWNDVWLNEALGTWAEGKITDAVEPGWKFRLGRDVGMTAGAMASDGQPTAQKIRLPVEDRDAVQNSFDSNITYAKGAAVLSMIEHWVGEPRFMAAIRHYLRAHAWGVADEEDFAKSLRADLGAPAAEVMASFVDQPGVPIIGAEVHCDGKPRVVLSQKRFFNAADKPSDALWRVPVCMRWDGGRTCVLLDARQKEVPLTSCPSWLVPNEDATGYYHSRYQAQSLAALRRVFASALTVRERVQLAADVSAEAEQGSLELGAALDLLPVFLADDDLRVFSQAVALLALLNPRELTQAQEAAFGRALTQLLGPRARTVGWEPKAGEDPEMANTRPLLLGLLAHHGHDRAIVAEARKRAERWLRDRRAVPADMVGPVLAMAAFGDDPKFFDRLLAEARKVKDRRERSLLLGTLGGFRTPALHRRALELLLGSEFDLRDSIGILYRCLFARETREASWKFLQLHFEKLVARMREDEALALFGGAPNAFCDAAHRTETEAFLGARAKAHPGAPHALEEALESVKACEASLARNQAAIAEFLKHY